MDQFSQRGDAPTETERGLLANATTDEGPDSRCVWVRIGQRIGVDALAVVLDELGGEKIYVPNRGKFFAALMRPVIAHRIHVMRSAGTPWSEIATTLGIGLRTAYQYASDIADDAAVGDVVNAPAK